MSGEHPYWNSVRTCGELARSYSLRAADARGSRSGADAEAQEKKARVHCVCVGVVA